MLRVTAYDKMKKCKFCNRTFGENTFEKHSQFCGSSIRASVNRTPGSSTTDRDLVKSEEYMLWLIDKFESQFERAPLFNASAKDGTASLYSRSIHESPRIRFEKLQEEKSTQEGTDRSVIMTIPSIQNRTHRRYPPSGTLHRPTRNRTAN
jgi:hypothetical protein